MLFKRNQTGSIRLRKLINTGSSRAACFVLIGLVGPAAIAGDMLVFDSLKEGELVRGIASKESLGGEYTRKGWISRSETGMLKIELEGGGLKEGILEVDVVCENWEKATRSSGVNRKLHFINMFSNGLGEHHAEDGGVEMDALWTLRHGITDDGSFRYSNGLKVLWASRGAKRSKGSDYDEKRVVFPNNIQWRENMSFRIEWSASGEYLRIHIDGISVANLPWKNQQSGLKYVFLGKSRDFYSLQGVYFSNLRIRHPISYNCR